MAPSYRLLLVACLLVGLRTTRANLLGNQDQVVQFGTYDAANKQCFFQKIFSGTISPQSVTFNNPAAKAITFISVEADQGFDFGGIAASITSGTVGTSTAITVQVTTTPQSSKFLNNCIVKMYCAA